MQKPFSAFSEEHEKLRKYVGEETLNWAFRNAWLSGRGQPLEKMPESLREACDKLGRLTLSESSRHLCREYRNPSAARA